MIPLIVSPLVLDFSPATERAVLAVDYLIWAVFAAEYAIKLYLAPNRRRFVLHHIPDLIIVVVPMLRPLRVLRSVRLLRLLRLTLLAGLAGKGFREARDILPGTDLDDLVFTGPGGGIVGRGTRTVLSRLNFRRTDHSALTKLADPATQLRPTAARVLKTLRATGPQTANELVVALTDQGRAIRPTTIQTAPGELAASGLAAADGREPARRCHHSSLPAIRCWTRSISAAPMTSGTPSRPGWRTTASQPG